MKYENGVEKLLNCNKMVEEMKIELEDLKPLLN